MIVAQGTVTVSLDQSTKWLHLQISRPPVVETGDVVDVVIIHEDDSGLSLLAGDELSVL